MHKRCLPVQGQFVKIAMNKHGSRSLDAIWNTAELKQKISIAEELSARVDQLSSHQ